MKAVTAHYKMHNDMKKDKMKSEISSFFTKSSAFHPTLCIDHPDINQETLTQLKKHQHKCSNL